MPEVLLLFAHVDVAALQIRLAQPCLGRHQVGRRDGEDNAVEIGQLHALGVDPVVIGIAHEHEALRRRRRREDPWVERRQIDVVVGVHHVHAAVDRHPARTRLAALRRFGDLGRVSVADVELLQVVRRPEQEQRRGLGLRFDEVGIGRIPAIANRRLVDDLDLGWLAVDQHHHRRA